MCVWIICFLFDSELSDVTEHLVCFCVLAGCSWKQYRLAGVIRQGCVKVISIWIQCCSSCTFSFIFIFVVEQFVCFHYLCVCVCKRERESTREVAEKNRNKDGWERDVKVGVTASSTLYVVQWFTVPPKNSFHFIVSVFFWQNWCSKLDFMNKWEKRRRRKGVIVNVVHCVDLCAFETLRKPAGMSTYWLSCSSLTQLLQCGWKKW